MKRFFATLTVTTLLLFSFAGCSKKTPENNPDTTPTPTAAVTDDAQATPSVGEDENVTEITEYVSFGGNFTKDDASISTYIGESGWEVVGVCTSAGQDTAVMTGLITYTEGTTFVYSDSDNEVALTYHASSMDVAVTKGSAYKGFEGTYSRMEQTTVNKPAPEETTKQELLGRVALTHYTLHPETDVEYTLDFSDAAFDNDYLNSFVLTYTDMYLLRGADIYPELSETTPYYPLSNDSLNDLLLTASAGKVDLNGFTVTDKIICKDDIYYIPCEGQTYGEVTVYPQEQDASGNTLYMEAYLAIAKKSFFDLKMTLTTSENASAGSTAMQIDTASFEQK